MYDYYITPEEYETAERNGVTDLHKARKYLDCLIEVEE